MFILRGTHDTWFSRLVARRITTNGEIRPTIIARRLESSEKKKKKKKVAVRNEAVEEGYVVS